MNKKPYETAEMRITLFGAEEVLAASVNYVPEATDADDLPIMPAN